MFDAFGTSAIAFLQAPALGAPGGHLGTSQTRSRARPIEPSLPICVDQKLIPRNRVCLSVLV